jgi:hypothetical protein
MGMSVPVPLKSEVPRSKIVGVERNFGELPRKLLPRSNKNPDRCSGSAAVRREAARQVTFA